MVRAPVLVLGGGVRSGRRNASAEGTLSAYIPAIRSQVDTVVLKVTAALDRQDAKHITGRLDVGHLLEDCIWVPAGLQGPSMRPEGMRGHGGPCVLAGLYGHFRAQPMPYCRLPSLVFGVSGRSLVFMIPVSAFAEEGVKPKDVDRWLLTAHESQWVLLKKTGLVRGPQDRVLLVGPCWSRPVVFSMATASGSVSAVLLQPWLASGVMERHLSVPEAFPWILECAELWACTAVPKAWKGVPEAVVSFLRGIRLGPDLAPDIRTPAPLEDAAAAAAPAQAPADPAADPPCGH